MSDFGDITSLEKTSLEAHVDLCAMRYGQLDARLTNLEEKMDAVQQGLLEGQKSLKSTIITSSGTIVVAIIGLIATILTKM
jgi:hypothetical protein